MKILKTFCQPFIKILQKIQALRNPHKRLIKISRLLETQLDNHQEKEKEKAWNTYNKALSIAIKCSHAELTQVILNFNYRFTENTFNQSLSMGQAISFLLGATPQNYQNLEAAWQLSSRLNEISSVREVKQEICLQLATLRNSNDTLLAKLQQRLNEKSLTIEEIAPIITNFLQQNSFVPPTPWKTFLEQFEFNELPRVHQIHGLFNRFIEASNLAEMAQEYGSAISYLMELSGTEIALRILTLSNQLGDENRIIQAHQRVAESLEKENNYREALKHFQNANNLEGVSNCYQRLGQLVLAIENRPDFTSEWRQDFRKNLQNTVRNQIHAQDFLTAVRLLKSLEDVWSQRSQKVEVENTQNLLLQALTTARAAMTRQLETCDNGKQEIFRQWSFIEEAAGNYLQAAIQAEQAEDYFTASVLFEQAEAFGQAIVALESVSEDAILPQKRAELLERGGDFFMAGSLYEGLGEIEQAIAMYEQASEFTKASQLLRQQLGDEKVVFDARYQQLLTKAGRIEELPQLCSTLAHKTERSSDEKARLWRRIRDLGELGLVGQQWLDLVKIELPNLERQNRQRFGAQASGWIKTATEQVLREYTNAIGLDLGTTNSVVCLYNKRSQEPEVIESLGKRQFPSVVAIDQTGKETIGVPILNLLAQSPRGIITKAKRQMGTDVTFQIGEQKYRAEEISARFINHAHKLAQDYLKEKIAQRISTIASETINFVPPTDWVNEMVEKYPPTIPLTNIVITVPAYFNEVQKQATKRAAVISENSLLRLIHEPTAACIAQQRYNKHETILVADLGAGTFDLSIVEVGEGVFEVKQIEGDNTLGSADLDELLYTHFEKFIREQTGVEIPRNSQVATRLRQACEELKIELSSQSIWTINLPYLVGEHTIELSLTREELERIASPWLERIRLTCHKIKAKPERILLIGGGCLMPAVCDCIQAIFQVDINYDIEPLTAVGRGAAVQAAILMGDLENTLLLDITPFGLGIQCVENPNTPEQRFMFDCLIPKHTSIPTQEKKCYSTAKDNQTNVEIQIFQGESLNPQENFKIGKFILIGIPLARAGVPQIEVTFDIDKNCLLTVTARDLGTGWHTSIEIADSHLLTPAQTHSLTEQFRRSQVYQQNITNLQKISLELTVILDDVKNVNLVYLSVRFQQRIQTYEQYRQRYAVTTTDNDTLFTIYRERNSLEDTTRVALDQWDSLSQSVRLWLERYRSLNWRSTDINAQVQQLLDHGIGLTQRTNQAKLNINDIATQYQRWLSILENLPLNQEGNAEQLARHLLSLQRYPEAITQFQRFDPPLSLAQIELGLEIFARSRQREDYTKLLLEHHQSLVIHPPDLENLNNVIQSYSSSLVWIEVNLAGLTINGTGFVISPHQIVTNRHLLIDEKTGNCVTSATIRVISQKGILKVTSIYLPSFGNDDLAILNLEEDSININPLRLGFSELVQVGERIIHLGFSSAQRNISTENIYCNTGFVNRIRPSKFCSERVLEVSITLQGEISASPVLNQWGEVIGLLTRDYHRGQSPTEQSFYGIPVNLLRRLCSEIDHSQDIS
ncbi:MAG: Hsp70 family protein [Crocosphaera sp.]|nr:Hsp70 family protein [Crocosphaera sp.]